MSHHSSDAYLQNPESHKWISTGSVNTMEHVHTSSECVFCVSLSMSFDTEHTHNMGWNVYPLCDVKYPPSLKQKMLSMKLSILLRKTGVVMRFGHCLSMWPVALLPGSVLGCSKTLFPRQSLGVFQGIVYSWKTIVDENGWSLGPSIIQTL